MGVAWDLNGCCEAEESLFLGLYGGYVAVFFLMWNTAALKPVRLLSTFIHEFGHASACWITGGKVDTIEVYNNEGGVTKYRGGWRWLVIPAGYVGGAFTGALFVALSGNRTGATIVAGVMTASLLATLLYKPNALTVGISLGFSAINIAAILIEYLVFDPFLEYVTLFYGVYIGFFSVRDIYDDLITRTAEGSDAVACSQLIPCCHPRCVGAQFWIVAFSFQVLGLYLALVWRVSNNDD